MQAAHPCAGSAPTTPAPVIHRIPSRVYLIVAGAVSPLAIWQAQLLPWGAHWSVLMVLSSTTLLTWTVARGRAPWVERICGGVAWIGAAGALAFAWWSVPLMLVGLVALAPHDPSSLPIMLLGVLPALAAHAHFVVGRCVWRESCRSRRHKAAVVLFALMTIPVVLTAGAALERHVLEQVDAFCTDDEARSARGLERLELLHRYAGVTPQPLVRVAHDPRESPETRNRAVTAWTAITGRSLPSD